MLLWNGLLSVPSNWMSLATIVRGRPPVSRFASSPTAKVPSPSWSASASIRRPSGPVVIRSASTVTPSSAATTKFLKVDGEVSKITWPPASRVMAPLMLLLLASEMRSTAMWPSVRSVSSPAVMFSSSDPFKFNPPGIGVPRPIPRPSESVMTVAAVPLLSVAWVS